MSVAATLYKIDSLLRGHDVTRGRTRDSFKLQTPSLLLVSKVIHVETMSELKSRPLVINNVYLDEFGFLGINIFDFIPKRTFHRIEHLHFIGSTPWELFPVVTKYLWRPIDTTNALRIPQPDKDALSFLPRQYKSKHVTVPMLRRKFLPKLRRLSFEDQVFGSRVVDVSQYRIVSASIVSGLADP